MPKIDIIGGTPVEQNDGWHINWQFADGKTITSALSWKKYRHAITYIEIMRCMRECLAAADNE